MKKSLTLNMPTGMIEVQAAELTILNRAKTPPFSVAEEGDVGEDLRLRYRYLDLRRPELANNMRLRHKAASAMRRFLDDARLPVGGAR